jgi:hypothetical protein
MGDFSKDELNALWSAQRAAEARQERGPDQPRKLGQVLGTQNSGLPGRSQPCARCSRTAEDYERKYTKDASPRILEAASYWRNGIRYWIANCEACNEVEFLQRWKARSDALEDPKEAGISELERNKRVAKLEKLREEYRRYYEAKSERLARQMSGVPTSGHAGTHRGSGLDEDALTSGVLRENLGVGQPSYRECCVTPAGGVPEEPAPDYATKRAEPSEGFADWWERQ